MLNLKNLSSYRENNRIEAKKAQGGLPISLWETYSAFANTLGGVILLGVEELKDKKLNAVNLENPQKLVDEFWKIVNDKEKVSANILSDQNVWIEKVDDKQIVVIEVPRARREEKPIFIGTNAMSGTYRRNGEGDYHCSKEEISSMQRDSKFKSQDLTLLENLSLDAIDFNSLKRFRQKITQSHKNLKFSALTENEFLQQIGGANFSLDGALHPTIAGLLMFGKYNYIIKFFPNFNLSYVEKLSTDDNLITMQITSTDKGYANLFEFYFAVCERITKNIRLAIKNFNNQEDCPVFEALREGLANCLINADYFGNNGIEIIKTKDGITFTNPGSFRVNVNDAKNGGVSDPRNSTLISIFNLISVGKRTGSGIPKIFKAWKKQGWKNPEIIENFSLNTTSLILSTKQGASAFEEKYQDKQYEEIIIDYLTEIVYAQSEEIAKVLSLNIEKTNLLIDQLVLEDVLSVEKIENKVYYKLKIK